MSVSLESALVAVGQAGGFAGVSGRPVTLVLSMAALSLLPFALLMMTSFVKVSVVLSILKSAIGTPQIPPGAVVTGLSLLMTVYIMAPTGQRMVGALEPLLEGSQKGVEETSWEQLVEAASLAREPLREFMLAQTSTRERGVFLSLSNRMNGAEVASDRDFVVVAPAFLTAELTRAFQIGFLLFVPFLIVDMVVANLLLALGMHMLSPSTVSLPFKLLLFVLADGWNLVLRGLVESYL